MNWKDYENITKYIYESLGVNSEIKILGYGKSCKVKGVSGVYHQIDVLTSHSERERNYKTAIECKFWKKKINKEAVMKLAVIIEDANIDKGIIVSKKGFTKDGISVAKYKNIGLVVLNEIENAKKRKNEMTPTMNLGILSVMTNMEIKRPKIISIDFDFCNKNQKMDEIDINQFTIILSTKKKIPIDYYLTSFKDKLHEEEIDKKTQKYYELKDALLFNEKSNEVIPINGFIVSGKLTLINKNSTRKFEIIDKVWMIMKSLFENESYSISSSGIIKKDNI